MNKTEPEPKEAPQAARRSFPRWLGVIWCGVGIPVAHGVVPWALSLITMRHGWMDGRPGVWNWVRLPWSRPGLPE